MKKWRFEEILKGDEFAGVMVLGGLFVP